MLRPGLRVNRYHLDPRGASGGSPDPAPRSQPPTAPHTGADRAPGHPIAEVLPSTAVCGSEFTPVSTAASDTPRSRTADAGEVGRVANDIDSTGPCRGHDQVGALLRTPDVGDDEIDDAQLVARIVAGDHAAFEEFYARYRRRCHSLAQRLTGSPALAEEAVQEAFATLWAQADRFNPGLSQPGGWLLMLTHHKAVDAVRLQMKDRNSLRPGLLPPAPVEDQAWAALRSDRIRAAVERLPAHQRQVLLLAFYDGHTYPEIAAETGIPLGTIKTRVHAAVRRLRRPLADLTDLI